MWFCGLSNKRPTPPYQSTSGELARARAGPRGAVPRCPSAAPLRAPVWGVFSACNPCIAAEIGRNSTAETPRACFQMVFRLYGESWPRIRIFSFWVSVASRGAQGARARPGARLGFRGLILHVLSSWRIGLSIAHRARQRGVPRQGRAHVSHIRRQRQTDTHRQTHTKLTRFTPLTRTPSLLSPATRSPHLWHSHLCRPM